mmetsp:Transcript_22255/g.34158  ORF Transcript_22255/g.34158 Transcript_22255/m.34158 type:complete len:342 (-) Transcript_22255:256-1281(-)
MPTTTVEDDAIQIHVVPTFGDNKEKKNRLTFKGRRRSSFESVASSVGSFGGLMDMFSSDPKECNLSSSDDNLHIDPEETFARTTPVGNRYDPSRLTPPNAVADFDLDGMNDDGSESLPDLDESYVIDETTGQRFSVPKKKEKQRLVQSPNSCCKQLTSLATIPLLILLSAGFLVFAFMITKSDSSTSISQTDGSNSMDILLYNTEVAVNAACTKQNADWEDLSTCRELCRSSMCCFDMSQSKSCYRGNEKSCLAHSACTAITSFPSQIIKPYNTEREKLVLSEMVVLACSRKQLDTNMSNCQKLCKNMLCCFDEEEQYNCASVKAEECLVHAGCEALVDSH